MIDADIVALSDGRLVSVRSSTGSDGSGGSIRASAADLVRTTTGDSTNETLLGDKLNIIPGDQSRDTITSGGANDSHRRWGQGLDHRWKWKRLV